MRCDNLFDQRSAGTRHTDHQYRRLRSGCARRSARQSLPGIRPLQVARKSGPLLSVISLRGLLEQLVRTLEAFESALEVTHIVVVLTNRIAQRNLLRLRDTTVCNRTGGLKPICLRLRHLPHSRLSDQCSHVLGIPLQDLSKQPLRLLPAPLHHCNLPRAMQRNEMARLGLEHFPEAPLCLVQAAPRNQNQSQSAMRLQVIGFQLDCASQRGLRLGKKSPPTQDVPEVAMCIHILGIDRQGSAKMPLGLYETAELGKRQAPVVERDRMPWCRQHLLIQLKSRGKSPRWAWLLAFARSWAADTAGSPAVAVSAASGTAPRFVDRSITSDCVTSSASFLSIPFSISFHLKAFASFAR